MELSEAYVVALLAADPEARVPCAARFARWKSPRPGCIVLSERQTYLFHYVDAKGALHWRHVFFPGFNPCTLYRL